METLIILSLIALLIIFHMSKRKRNSKLRARAKDKIQGYITAVPSFCKGKTMSEIIENYCEVFGITNKDFYRNLYQPDELKSIIHL